MWTQISKRNVSTILFVLCFVFASFATNAVAQTPESSDPPPPPPPAETETPTETPTEIVIPAETEVPTETETPTETTVPTETETPAETTVPTETETPAETTVPNETETPTEIAVPTDVATETPGTPGPSPTPTEQPIVPDQLIPVSANAITIAPGAYADISVQYTLGSDRQKTELSGVLSAPGGESLDQWSLTPVNRADTDQDSNDVNRDQKARIDVADVTLNGDVFESTWRVTAPDHIEQPVNLKVSFSAKTHRDDGVVDGAIQMDLVSITASASVHAPTVQCDAAVAEDVQNTFNCVFNTTHPEGNIAVSASADVPTGWEMTLNGGKLAAEPTAVTVDEFGTGSFTLAATYPIGCPDVNVTFSASISLAMTYPSGEASTLTTELPLTFERPTPKLEISSFQFADINDMKSLVTQGQLVLTYTDAPCGWQGSIELSDLTSEDLTIDNALFSVVGVESDGGITVTATDNVLSILAPASSNSAAAGTITIDIQLELPHLIPPAIYVIKVIMEISRPDEI